MEKVVRAIQEYQVAKAKCVVQYGLAEYLSGALTGFSVLTEDGRSILVHGVTDEGPGALQIFGVNEATGKWNIFCIA
jgi:hypothetical protein